MSETKIDKWNGERSIRIRKGDSWICASLEERPAAFALFNSKKFRWQVQTWKPVVSRTRLSELEMEHTDE